MALLHLTRLELNLWLFNVMNDFNREALDSEVDFSLMSWRAIRAFKQIISD